MPFRPFYLITLQAERSIAPGTIQFELQHRGAVEGWPSHAGVVHLSRCSLLHRCCFVGIIRSSIEDGNKWPPGQLLLMNLSTTVEYRETGNIQ
jgi:hypothetical protein